MKAFLAGLFGKFTGSAVSTNVGGRIYLDRAPERATFPYIVFSVIAAIQDDTFTDKIDEYLVQFSIYSVASSAEEIGTAYGNLIALLDDATFTVTGDTLLKCQRDNTVTLLEDITTTEGEIWCRHWAVDYRMVVKD